MKTIKLSGTVGVDVTAADFEEALRGAGGGDVEIAIASPGGSVFDGIEIYNAIRAHKRNNPGSKITVRIVGLAASMASYIASVDVADKVIAEDNAVFMIHHPWNVIAGDHREMQKNSEFLKGLSGILAQSYSRKTKKGISAINSMMDAETWLYGDEIKEAGFVDEIIPSSEGSQASSKSAAVAMARARFADSMAKMKARAEQEAQKAAAMIPSFFTESLEPRREEAKPKIDPVEAAINEVLLEKLTAELGKAQGIEPWRPGQIVDYDPPDPEEEAWNKEFREKCDYNLREFILPQKRKEDAEKAAIQATREAEAAYHRMEDEKCDNFLRINSKTYQREKSSWKPGEIEEV